MHNCIYTNEHVYSHRGNVKTVKNKITIKEKETEKKIKMKYTYTL